jgi:hypothetical protein
MPRLVNTPDALAGLIPRTDSPPTGPLTATEVSPPLPPKPVGAPLAALQHSDDSSVMPLTTTAPSRPWVKSHRTGSPSSSHSELRKEKEKCGWAGSVGNRCFNQRIDGARAFHQLAWEFGRDIHTAHSRLDEGERHHSDTHKHRQTSYVER